MKFRLFGLSILCLLVLALANLNSLHTYSQGKNESVRTGLSKDEQDLFNEINQARAHPDIYAGYMEKLKPLFSGKLYKGSLSTAEGWAAVEDAIAFLRATKPLPPLGTSWGLSLAASTHVKDQSGSGATGHRSGNSGSMIEDRVKPFGTWQGGIGENLSYGNDSARERVLTWLIDDGFASRGHRKRIMSPDYKVAGLCCGPHPEYGGMCALALAGGFMDSTAVKTSTDSATRSDANGTTQAAKTVAAVSAATKSNSNTNAAATSNSGPANTNKSKATITRPPKL